jgi:hypothetical protein
MQGHASGTTQDEGPGKVEFGPGQRRFFHMLFFPSSIFVPGGDRFGVRRACRGRRAGSGAARQPPPEGGCGARRTLTRRRSERPGRSDRRRARMPVQPGGRGEVHGAASP